MTPIVDYLAEELKQQARKADKKERIKGLLKNLMQQPQEHQEIGWLEE
jgi:hypothetical protein